MLNDVLFTLEVEVDEAVSVGATPNGEIRLLPFQGGTFTGADVKGRVLPGGTDWQRVRPDGVVEIRAHYVLETDRGERVEVTSEGIRHAAPGVLERIARGESVSPQDYYFRTFVRLYTAAERLAHWNRLLVVTVGERTRSAVRLTFHAIR